MSMQQSPLRRSANVNVPSNVQRLVHYVTQHPNCTAYDASRAMAHISFSQEEITSAQSAITAQYRAEKNMRMSGSEGWRD